MPLPRSLRHLFETTSMPLLKHSQCFLWHSLLWLWSCLFLVSLPFSFAGERSFQMDLNVNSWVYNVGRWGMTIRLECKFWALYTFNLADSMATTTFQWNFLDTSNIFPTDRLRLFVFRHPADLFYKRRRGWWDLGAYNCIANVTFVNLYVMVSHRFFEQTHSISKYCVTKFRRPSDTCNCRQKQLKDIRMSLR